MKSFAVHKYAPLSAQKARLVANQIRGESVEKALSLLGFNDKKAAGLLKKVLVSAMSNAENNGSDLSDLVVHNVAVDEATRIRRWHARGRGRGSRILKRRCHITVVLLD